MEFYLVDFFVENFVGFSRSTVKSTLYHSCVPPNGATVASFVESGARPSLHFLRYHLLNKIAPRVRTQCADKVRLE